MSNSTTYCTLICEFKSVAIKNKSVRGRALNIVIEESHSWIDWSDSWNIFNCHCRADLNFSNKILNFWILFLRRNAAFIFCPASAFLVVHQHFLSCITASALATKPVLELHVFVLISRSQHYITIHSSYRSIVHNINSIHPLSTSFF